MGDRQVVPRVPKDERRSEHGPCPLWAKLSSGAGPGGVKTVLLFGTTHTVCGLVAPSNEIALISHHPVHVFLCGSGAHGQRK
jgi:hypothetical protein